jgi:two-component sensor histidine kinase
MMSDTNAPVDEPEVPIALALGQRIRQQEILSELGRSALRGANFDHLLDNAARLSAQGMRAQFAKVLEYLPDENELLVRAGVGWEQGVVGVAKIGADLASPAGFALRTGKPVISNNLENEGRFRTPDLLLRHGIRRAMNVILEGDGKPFGVLEVDSRNDDQFVQQDLAFLQSAANILGLAIERERREQNLKAALERQEMLLHEVSHRVKNSLAIVASMLKLQSTSVGDAILARHLENAARRVAAVATAHERIHRNDGSDRIDLGAYIKSVCEDLDAALFHCDIRVDADAGIDISTDRAIAIALIANELITNAVKYAYGDSPGGEICVRLARGESGTIALSVRDNGCGLPTHFDLRTPAGLGMRIVKSFAMQLKARLDVRRLDPGTEFALIAPIDPATRNQPEPAVSEAIANES